MQISEQGFLFCVALGKLSDLLVLSSCVSTLELDHKGLQKVENAEWAGGVWGDGWVDLGQGEPIVPHAPRRQLQPLVPDHAGLGHTANRMGIWGLGWSRGRPFTWALSGSGPDGAEEIKRHAFYSTIDWNVSVSLHPRAPVRASPVVGGGGGFYQRGPQRWSRG